MRIGSSAAWSYRANTLKPTQLSFGHTLSNGVNETTQKTIVSDIPKPFPVLSYEIISEASGDKAKSPLLAEIMEQPSALRRLLSTFATDLKKATIPADAIKQLILLGEGSSNNALSIAAPYIHQWTGLPVKTLLPAEAETYTKQQAKGRQDILNNTLVVGASQSGKSSSTLNGIKQFSDLYKTQDKPFLFIPITNNANEVMSKTYGNHIDLMAGPENAIAATKSMTNTIAAALLLGINLAQSKGTSSESSKEVMAELNALPDKLEAFLTDPRVHQRIKQFALTLADKKRFVLLSSDAVASVLPEAGLKLTETTESWVKTDNMESFKHGPKVILGQKPATVYIVPPALKPEDANTFYNDVQAHFKINATQNFPTNKMAFILFKNSPAIPKELFEKYNLNVGKNILKLPSTQAFKSPVETQFLSIITFQLLSYYMALAKGVNPNHGALSKVVI